MTSFPKMKRFDVILNDYHRTWSVSCYAGSEKIARENIQRQECDHMDGVRIMSVIEVYRDTNVNDRLQQRAESGYAQ